ncbi:MULTISPECIES: hypothetical protein [Bacteroidota]|uniref:hypothetical protein n=1 Tax=Bacteroidota TaxID=976 RepID=UPI000ACC1F26|nr:MULTISPECIES: hypothetical protein [Bacteroidota]MBN9302198.1 hypothetical protein [Dysgonomonas mossii]
MLASPNCCVLPCHPPGLIPFPFGFTLLPAWIICFLFSGFSFGKIYAKRSGANHNGKRETRKASE